MPIKKPQSMISRYKGKGRKQHLLDALCRQQIVAGKIEIAEKLIKKGSLEEIGKGSVIIQQNNMDNDLYLIVSGEVDVVINERVIATRGEARHIGEMALLDPTARRSGTIIAKEQLVYLKVSENDLTEIAKQHPEIWRRMAIELANRLRERSKYVSQPNAIPMTFIGSSSESINEAKWLSNSMNRRKTVSKLWTEGVFQISGTVIEDLLVIANESDFAAILFTPDDITKSRGKRIFSPRDNVVFELGLFMGILGQKRTFIITPKDIEIKLPTDLLGLTRIVYNPPNGTSDLRNSLSPVSNKLWTQIKQLGPR